MRVFTVKARERTGSPSFDLTIPTEIAKTYEIGKGDVFEVSVTNDGGELKIVYRLVYRRL